MEGVDYLDTFIAVAEDCPAAQGTAPPCHPQNPSVAARTFQMVAEHPYRFTSGDVIFTVFADRRGVPEEQRAARRDEFYSTGQACLRCSDLAKRFGWGIHADDSGRVALIGVETPEYAEFLSGRRFTASGASIKTTRAMRNALWKAG